MKNKEITVKLPIFEGPLDLLLHLLEKNKVNVYDIPIVEITNQYLEYMEQMKKQDLDIMSEFLVMAATLIDIKSKMLLPKPAKTEEVDDPRAELVQQLLEYKMYKCMSYELKERQVDAQKVMFHKPEIPPEVKSYEEPVDLDELLSGLTITKLNHIFKSIMRRQENRVDPIRSKFGRIEKEEVALPDKIREVEAYAKKHRVFGFRNLLETQHSKVQIIVTFLAILEMMKTGKIYISQQSIEDDIRIESRMEEMESA